MTAFNLSPGITPELTDAVLAEFVGLLAIAYVAWGGRGVELVVGANALALGAIKLLTDYSDLGDWPVAFGGIIAGAWVVWSALRDRRPRLRHRTLELVVGVVAMLIGLVKAARDFYDPFDLTLAGTLFACGLWLVSGRYGSDRAAPPRS
jgi:xanthine/uracil permease